MSDDESQISSDLKALDDKLRSRLQDALESAIDKGLASAKTDHRWKSRTGETANSFYHNVSTTSDGGVGSISTDSENALRLADGTQPHEIRPKEGEGFKGPLRKGQSRRKQDDIGTHRVALRWQQDGATRFATVVHHPGTEPDPYLDNAAEVAMDALDEGIEKALDEVFGGGS